jgi:hypothetical protein
MGEWYSRRRKGIEKLKNVSDDLEEKNLFPWSTQDSIT